MPGWRLARMKTFLHITGGQAGFYMLYFHLRFETSLCKSVGELPKKVRLFPPHFRCMVDKSFSLHSESDAAWIGSAFIVQWGWEYAIIFFLLRLFFFKTRVCLSNCLMRMSFAYPQKKRRSFAFLHVKKGTWPHQNLTLCRCNAFKLALCCACVTSSFSSSCCAQENSTLFLLRMRKIFSKIFSLILRLLLVLNNMKSYWYETMVWKVSRSPGKEKEDRVEGGLRWHSYS